MAIVCEIDATGIHKPDFSEILEYLKTEYRGIYGEDVYLENDSQDGQLLGIFAAAINDANAMAVAVYNAFSPSTAQGAGLSRVVKINGISRNLPSYSSADLEIVGQAGTTILGGLARDVNGYLWALPSVVNIPPGGAITVTATAQQVGAVAAAAGEINAIATIGVNGASLIRNFVETIGGGIFLGSAQYSSVGTLPMNNYFVTASLGAVANFAQANFTNIAATGARYNATIGGIISTNGGGANFLPGSVAGVTSSGGVYA